MQEDYFKNQEPAINNWALEVFVRSVQKIDSWEIFCDFFYGKTRFEIYLNAPYIAEVALQAHIY